jgi:methyl-accepting chemotaxis protein
MLIAFMGVQSYLSLNTINTLQDTTKKVFGQQTGTTNEVFEIRVRLEKIRSDYLAALSNEALFGIDSGSAYSDITFISGRMDLVNIPAAKKQEFKNMISEIKAIMDKPVSSANYKILNQQLTKFNILVLNLNKTLIDQNINTMSDGNRLSQKLKYLTVLLLIISIIVSAAIGLKIAQSISGPLRKVVKETQLLAIGNLSQNNTATIGSPEIIEVVKGLIKQF